MRIGIFVPTGVAEGQMPDAEGIAVRSRAIEDAGLDGIWVTDSLAPEFQPRPDPLSWALTASLATRQIEIGTAAYIISNRNPVDVAQRILTLEQLTPGRFVYGVGAGSAEAAHRALGADFTQRFHDLYAHMDVIRRLCRGEQVGDAVLRPHESVRCPQFLLGVWQSDRSLRHAIDEFDGWMISGGRTAAGAGTASLEHLASTIARYRELGGTERAIVLTVQLDLTVTSGRLAPNDPFSLRCSKSEAADRIRRLEDLGYDDVLVINHGFDRSVLDDLRALSG